MRGTPVFDKASASHPGTKTARWSYRRMRLSNSVTTEIVVASAVAIALTATLYYAYLAWLLAAPD